MLTLGNPQTTLDGPPAKTGPTTLQRRIEQDANRDPVDALRDAETLQEVLQGAFDALRDRVQEDMHRPMADAITDARAPVRHNRQRWQYHIKAALQDSHGTGHAG